MALSGMSAQALAVRRCWPEVPAQRPGGTGPWTRVTCTRVLHWKPRRHKPCRGIGWHTSFVGEASAAGADDSKLDAPPASAAQPPVQRINFSKSRINVPCCNYPPPLCLNQPEALWPNG